MLSAAQAEGYGPSGEGDGSILEEYMDSLLVMPVEVRRYITLLRELDGKCEREVQQVQAKQQQLVEAAKKRTANLSPADRTRTLKQLREEPEWKELEHLRARLYQKIAEKKSISEQLYDMSEQNLKRINGDIKYLESLFQRTGELPDLEYQVGRDVAAWMEKEQVWILARIAQYSPQEPSKVIVADADNSSALFTLTDKLVVVLPEKESLTAAKARLPTRGRKVFAMYPDTTSFYKGTILSVPWKESGVAAPAGSTRQPQPSIHPPGTTLCNVQFEDDVDPVTGLTYKHAIPTRFVFPEAH
mmetsp:Transcript_21089/g.39195  ORF Transcript_21089/g.39195 Transcript_21089/m.39195 type:complete len:301 (+) Transcript_21089:130-1032(+)